MNDLTKYFDDPDSEECIEWLVSAFKKHILEGGTMDELLGIVSVGFNAPSARTTYLRKKRVEAITTSWDLLCIDNPNWSDWRCSQELFKKVSDRRNKGELIQEIQMCTQLLGDKGYGNVDSLHAVACRSNNARIELITELLDTVQDT